MSPPSTTSSRRTCDGRKYGRDRTTVIKVIQHAGVKRQTLPARRGGRVRIDPEDHISDQHGAVGIKLNLFRTIRKDWSVSEMADELVTHSYMVSKMESGQHEFTLSQLQRIANLLGMTVPDLITPPSASGSGAMAALVRA